MVLVLGGLVLLAACSDGDNRTFVADSMDDATTTTVVTADQPQTTTTDSVPPEPDLTGLEVLWAQLWEAAGLVPEARAGALGQLGTAMDPVVVEAASGMLDDATERRVSTFPVFEEGDYGSIEIRDCIIYDPMIFESATHVHSGTAVPDGEGGWIITSVSRETSGCVPAQLQAEILEDYAEFWEAQIEYTNPVNPDHPGIERTQTVQRQEAMRPRLVEAQVKGRYVVAEVIGFHPEISGVSSANRAEVLDCIEFGPGTGFFERSGERVGGVEPIWATKTDLYTVTMKKEGPQWLVDFVAIDIQEDCDFAPTPVGLPAVGS